MNNNKNLLVIIAAALVGILAILGIQAYNSNKEPATLGESIDKVIGNAQDDAKELKEEIKDEIDDHTTDTK